MSHGAPVMPSPFVRMLGMSKYTCIYVYPLSVGPLPQKGNTLGNEGSVLDGLLTIILKNMEPLHLEKTARCLGKARP